MARGSKSRRTKSHSHASGKKKRNATVQEEQQQVAPVETAGQSSNISLLPLMILTDILLRLPFKTIFSCRCVCKTWLSVLLDPDFAQLYQARAPSSIILQPQNDILKQYLYAVDLEASDSSNHAISISHYSVRVKFDTQTQLSPQSKLSLVDSCNGLILLCESFRMDLLAERLYVCNPITGEFVIVRPIRANLPHWVSPRLGFCPNSRKFKVVIFVNKEDGADEKMPTDVYTLGREGGWRSVLMKYDVRSSVRDTTFLNGFIHFLWGRAIPELLIRSFDVENEKFQPVPPPPLLDSSLKTGGQRMSLGVLGGCLALAEFPYDDGRCFHVWVMKEYGVQSSWTKEWSINVHIDIPMYSVPCCHIVGLLGNGDILILHHEKTMFSFNRANRTCKYHRIDKIHYFQALPYVPNFSSLTEIASGEEVFNARFRMF
ncbi:hypothetical protein F2P56_001249 [Juglans regia]|uniref:F-box protein At3g07870-like n=2 Tax=Juglans regia TaxID=51240 RepID=A0A2I4F6Y2_JUGRE|nr:F-box protein At3g07870-like [Juglans regia]XP_035551301.1 F-box protein At3g07870-like [Juglans regia]KAF5480506.1 hypothetical protein F2P56_001249 [Juglans regia]